MPAITDYFICILDAFLLYLFFNTLLPKRRPDITFKFLLTAYVSCLCYVIITNSLAGNISLFASYIRSFAVNAMYFGLSYFFEGPFVFHLLVTACYWITGVIAEDTSYLLLSRLAGISFESDMIPDSLYIALMILTDLIIFIITLAIRLIWRPKANSYSIRYTLLCLMTPILSAFLCLSPPFTKICYQEPDTYLVLLCFLLSINLVNYILIQSIANSEYLKQENKRLSEQIEYQENKYHQLTEAYKAIRSFMHDTKKHLFYIEECVNHERYGDIIPYSRKTMADLESRYCTINTGHLVVDAFISNMLLQTTKHGFQLQTTLKIQNQKLPLDDYYMTIILGNLLDNALNACLEQHSGNINILMHFVNKTFVISIDNTYIIPPDQKAPAHIEEVDFIHGYGLKNVKKAAAACNGFVDMRYKNNVYRVTVVIPVIE